MKRLQPLLLASATLVAVPGMALAAPQAPAAPGDAPSQATAASDQADQIIVTGTRASGITSAESAAPIKLVGAEAISHVGQPNLNQVLQQLVPSFTAQTYGGDTASLTLTASLRGLNPNQTLVLVNGKRRHGTSNLQVYTSPFQGGAAPDLDFITPASIDHIEVLEDGAAAQYGSDAIAGVINVILKKKEGGAFSITGGQYYAGDGKTGSASLNYGYVGERAFINLTGFYRFHGFSKRGDYDVRVFDPATGGVPGGIDPVLAAAYRNIKDYPNINPTSGDPRSHFAVGSYNAGIDIGETTQLYSFGSFGYRRAQSHQNVRLPDLVVGSNDVDPTTRLFLPGTYGAPGALVPRPRGFVPEEEIREQDYQSVAGIRGTLGSLGWDLSTSYGADRARIYTTHSINASLYLDTHDDQADFYDGLYRASEWVSNLDLTYTLGQIATLSAGAEYRRNTYTIRQGEPASYYGGGAESFPGVNPLAAGKHARHNWAAYGDAALTPADGLKIDVALRHEQYSDFGDTTNWKVTSRYDFTPQIAVRGTVSTGFRAPTLAEESYTAINVAPYFATAQLAANSAAAKVLGIQDLRPEKSRSYSAGLVLRPLSRLTATIDAYQVRIRDRIVGSGYLAADGTSSADPVARAIQTAGVTLAPGIPAFVAVFANGPTTRTRGVDVVGSYDADFNAAGRASFSLSAAYNKTKIRSGGATPAIVASAGQSLFNPGTYSALTTAIPHWKIIGGVNWSLGKFRVIARETYFSKSVFQLDNFQGSYIRTVIRPAFVSDLEIDYSLTSNVTIALGATNLFNKEPTKVRFDQFGILPSGTLVAGVPNPLSAYGYNGGYYYARVGVSF